jgi:hypothetical protein
MLVAAVKCGLGEGFLSRLYGIGITPYSAAVVPALCKVREKRGTHNCDTFGS